MLRRTFRALPNSVRKGMDKLFVKTLLVLPLRQRIKLTYFKTFGRFPNLKDPKLYSEKLQARKLSGENFTRYIDKIAAKEFVHECVEDICIPTLYSGDTLPPRNERNWRLPYVIKTNHASGTNIFVRDEPDWDAIEAELERMLAYRHGAISGEVFYLQVKPRVLVEPLIGNGIEAPVDYRFFVAGGEVQFIVLDQDPITHSRVFYSPDWERLPIRDCYPVGVDAERPKNLVQMNSIAKLLGKELGFVRVDLYEADGCVYFGELTLAPTGGYMRFEPAEIDAMLGEMWG